MEVTFTKLHNIAIDSLTNIELGYQARLEMIGRWVYNFLHTENEEINLTIPYFEFRLAKTTFHYIKYLLLLNRIVNLPRITRYQGTCLFDVFNYKYNSKGDIELFLLDFVNSKEQIAIWKNNTITNEKMFLPIFLKEQIKSKAFLDKIFNSFNLFKLIRKRGLVNYPVLIDLNEDMFISLTPGEHLLTPEFVSFDDISYLGNMELSQVREIAINLESKNINTRLGITYPYHRNIHPFLLRSGNKKIALNFNSRFFHNGIKENELSLLPKEYTGFNGLPVTNPVEKYLILTTNHNPRIFELLHNFKEDWNQQGFNKYTTPFPKYWFMFINKHKPLKEWIAIFKNNYPIVAEKPIIKTVEQIISELYELNWIINFIKDINGQITFVFPELKGWRERRLSKSYRLFKNYVYSLNPQVQFIQEITTQKGGNIYFLNGFDTTTIANEFQTEKGLIGRVLIPDFIYYSYQPWIPFHVFEYQKQALINSQRELLDENFSSNKEQLRLIRNKLIENIKVNKSSYTKKFRLNFEETTIESITEKEENTDLTNDEENSILYKKELKSNFDFIITTNYEEIIKLKRNHKIYIQRNSLVQAYPNDLNEKDLFFKVQDLTTILEKTSFLDQLSEIPESVHNYQCLLSKSENAYEALEKEGLEYKGGKSYFNKHFLLEGLDIDLFRIPRKKKNWEIICNYLSIDFEEMNLAFIAYYGRKKKNKIRDLYKKIIDTLFNNEWIGAVENPEVKNKISKMVLDNKEIFDSVDGFDASEIAELMISNIIGKFSSLYKQVKEINTKQL